MCKHEFITAFCFVLSSSIHLAVMAIYTGRSDEIVPLNCLTYHCCRQGGCSGNNTCSPTVHSPLFYEESSCIIPTDCPVTWFINRFLVLLAWFWDGAGVGLLCLKLVNSRRLQNHFVHCKTHLHHNFSMRIKDKISHFQKQSLKH